MEQVKSRQRVIDHGEVFTSDREVNAMLDLVDCRVVNQFNDEVSEIVRYLLPEVIDTLLRFKYKEHIYLFLLKILCSHRILLKYLYYHGATLHHLHL